MSRLQLQSPGHYSPLEAFYEDKRALLPSCGGEVVTGCPASAWGATINHSMHPEMKVWRIFSLPRLTAQTQMIVFFSISVCVSVHEQITHPAGCMSQFIRFFGEQIMVLWKLALLRRRILIFSPPPVGVVCYRGGEFMTCLFFIYAFRRDSIKQAALCLQPPRRSGYKI